MKDSLDSIASTPSHPLISPCPQTSKHIQQTRDHVSASIGTDNNNNNNKCLLFKFFPLLDGSSSAKSNSA